MNKLTRFLAPLLIALSPAFLKANTAAEYTPASSSIGALPGGARIDAQTFTVEEPGVLTSVDLLLNPLDLLLPASPSGS